MAIVHCTHSDPHASPLSARSRLTQIFAVSRAYLYHAYAWLKLFNFSRSYNKNLSTSDVSMMATSVVLATLSILPYERNLFGRVDELSQEQEKERTLHMANILGFSVVRSMPHSSLPCCPASCAALLCSGSAVRVEAISNPSLPACLSSYPCASAGQACRPPLHPHALSAGVVHQQHEPAVPGAARGEGRV